MYTNTIPAIVSSLYRIYRHRFIVVILHFCFIIFIFKCNLGVIQPLSGKAFQSMNQSMNQSIYLSIDLSKQTKNATGSYAEVNF